MLPTAPAVHSITVSPASACCARSGRRPEENGRSSYGAAGRRHGRGQAHLRDLLHPREQVLVRLRRPKAPLRRRLAAYTGSGGDSTEGDSPTNAVREGVHTVDRRRRARCRRPSRRRSVGEAGGLPASSHGGPEGAAGGLLRRGRGVRRRRRARSDAGGARGRRRAAALLRGGRAGVPRAQPPPRLVLPVLRRRHPRAVPPPGGRRLPQGVRRADAAGHGAAGAGPVLRPRHGRPVPLLPRRRGRAARLRLPAARRVRRHVRRVVPRVGGRGGAVVRRRDPHRGRRRRRRARQPHGRGHHARAQQQTRVPAGLRRGGPAGHLHRQRGGRAAPRRQRRRRRVDVRDRQDRRRGRVRHGGSSGGHGVRAQQGEQLHPHTGDGLAAGEGRRGGGGGGDAVAEERGVGAVPRQEARGADQRRQAGAVRARARQGARPPRFQHARSRSSHTRRRQAAAGRRRCGRAGVVLEPGQPDVHQHPVGARYDVLYLECTCRVKTFRPHVVLGY